MPEKSLLLKNSFTQYFTLIIICFALTIFAGQYLISRENFIELLGWQIILHIIFVFLYFKSALISIKQIIIAACILRIGTSFIMPSLSDDIYRFIWDGQLIVHSQNPMLTTPDNYLLSISQSYTGYAYYFNLHGLINHPQFYTCYPPFMQLIFTVAAFIGGNSIIISAIIIKIILAFSDIIAIIFLIKILKKLKLNEKLVILYALNPLVIIEGAGNAHFEVLQIALMLCSIFYILEKKYTIAALFWGAAIITKLLPLLLLPLILRYLGFKKGIIFCFTSIACVLVSFLPFVSIQSINAFSQSLNLYFQNFEFNASIYYVAREVGWWVKGYNYIHFIGPLLMGIFLLIYTSIFFYKKKISNNEFSLLILIIFSLYYLFATTVHPWYIINLLPFAIIANKKYGAVWMAAAFLSYNTYGNAAFKENYYLITFEYLIIAAAMIYSFRAHKKNQLYSV